MEREGVARWLARSDRPARPRRPAAADADRARSEKAFPGQGRPRQGGAGGRRRVVRRAEGRDAGRRRRVRLRQVHPGAAAAASARAGCGRTGVRRRGGRRGGRHPGRCAAPPGADGVSGFLRVAEPAHADPRLGRVRTVRPGQGEGGGARHRPRHAAQGRHGPGAVRAALSARAVRRPEAARQHRPRAGDRPAHGDPRRAGLGARQIGRGAGAEPAARAEAAVQPDLCLHQPRSRRRPLHQRPGPGHVSRAGRRARPGRRGLRGAAPPVHAGVARLAAVDGPEPAHRRAADHRRPAEPDRPALGLPLPHALPVRRAGLRRGRAGARLARPAERGACRRLPHARPALRPQPPRPRTDAD